MRKIVFVLLALAVITESYSQSEDQSDSELPPGWWKLPKTNTQFKIGGYVKLDMIHDFDPIGSPDFFDVSKIPTDGSKGESTNLHAKETRLLIDTRTPTKIGTVRAYVEGDFYGSGGSFRLRHAFVELGETWLAGQWWSNFMDENIIPATLDFEKPAAYVFARHAMLRWKKALSDHAYLAIALESPNANGQEPPQAGEFESPLPDLTMRYRLTKDWGHVQLSAFAAQIRYRYASGGKDNLSLFGINLSGQYKLLQKDYLIYQLVYGPGVGRFRGGLSVALDENDELEALTDFAFTVGYQHFWTEKFSSLFTYNWGSNDNTAGQPGSDIHQIGYFAGNFLWHVLDNAFVGVEYLHGRREDKSELDGTANRLQFSVKYIFN